MPQTNFTAIQLYRSATASAVPSAANLVVGELALNYNDGRLYYEDSGGAVQMIGAKLGSAAVATFLGTPSSANLASAITDETGSGSLVFGTSPTLADPTTTGQVRNALGLVGAPSLSFTGDLNTGIWSSGADELDFSTAGVNRLAISTTAFTSALPVVHPLGAVGTPSITFTGDLNTGVWSPGADTVAVSTAGAESFRVNSAGRVLVASSTDVSTASSSPYLQVSGTGTTGGQSRVGVNRFSADVSAPALLFGKSRGATVGTFTAVADNDELLNINAHGADGTDLQTIASRIVTYVDGTVSANIVPGRIAFETANSAGTLVEHVTIKSTGFVGIGIDTPTALGSGGTPHVLQVHSTGTGTTNFGYLALSSAATGNTSLMGAIAFGSTGLSGADKRTAQITSSKSDALTVNPVGDLKFQTANGGAPATRLIVEPDGDITPGADGTQTFGGSGAEWSTVYTRTLLRNSAGDLQINSANAAGTITLRTAGADKLLVAANGILTHSPTAATNTFYSSGSFSGNYNGLEVNNASNTASSDARIAASVAGTSAGDPFFLLSISGGTSYALGADNSDSDTFKIATGGVIGSGNTLGFTSDGRLYGTALHNNAGSVTGTTNQYVASGTYTPTATGTANIDSVTGGKSQWIRVGNVVHVTGVVTVDATTATTSTAFRLTLPIASNLAASADLAGVAVFGNSSDETWLIFADTANDAASFSATARTTGSHIIPFTFTYEVK